MTTVPFSRLNTAPSADTLYFEITAPDVGAGAYYILGVADTAFEVETNRENNGASNPLPVLDANLSR